jgi:mannose-6-phosphate isomerase-like protein (cupin superfamily)
MAKHDWVAVARRIDKPWGHEEVFALVPGKFCGKALYVRGGESLSLQYHERKEETICVQTGALQFEVGWHESELERFTVGPGETVRLLPGVRHRLTALGDTVLLEASTTELDDVVRLEDRYGRAGSRSA